MTINTQQRSHHVLGALGTVAALAMCAGPAQAQDRVTLYGVVGTQVVYASGINSVRKLDSNSIVDSRLGFKGVEDLGGGLKAFFQIEGGLNTDTGQGQMFNRGSFVGVAGQFGSVSLGRRLNPNDSHLCGFFVCDGYAGFYNFPGFGNASAFVDNAINYRSPDSLPFKGSLMVAPGEGNGRYAAGAATYDIGPVTLGAGYDTQRNAAGGTSKLMILGAKAVLKDGFVRVSYGKTKPAAGGLPDGSALDIGGGINLGPLASVSLDYVRYDQKNSANDANFVRFVAVYRLSKRTSLNGNLIRFNNKGASAIALAGATVAPGKSQDVVTLGVVHSF